jgi:hypothetical protein
METNLQRRILFIAILLGVFAVLLVWAGTVQPDPDKHNYPGPTNIHDTPEQYVGERVLVGGVVVETEPLTIESTVGAGEKITFIITDSDLETSRGNDVQVYGALQPDNRVVTIDTVHREPWERQYMYVVSFLAGLLVLGRLLNDWTIETADWTVVPRTTRLIDITGKSDA